MKRVFVALHDFPARISSRESWSYRSAPRGSICMRYLVRYYDASMGRYDFLYLDVVHESDLVEILPSSLLSVRFVTLVTKS